MININTNEYLKHKLISTDLYKNLGLKINYYDIGASGNTGKPWSLLDECLLKVIGFEPDYQSYLKIVNKFPNNIYHNTALWSKKTIRNYYMTQQDYYSNFNYGTSSMYPPNIIKNSNHHGVIDKGRVVEKIIQVNCDTLDNVDIKNEDIPDFIKIDTQGSEYKIIKGAKKLLKKNAPIITLETWTEEIYKNAPLMHKIMNIMQKYGYELYSTQIAAQRYYKTNKPVHCKAKIAGFELFYVKSPKKMYILTENQFIKQIAILEIFGFRDYALYLLDNLKIIKEELHYEIYDILLNNGKITEQLYCPIRQ